MKQNYSDRDYFEEKFQSIDERFDILEKKVDRLALTLFGNGHIGLVEQVRNNSKKISMAFSLIAVLTPIYIKESRDTIIKFIESLIHGL